MCFRLIRIHSNNKLMTLISPGRIWPGHRWWSRSLWVGTSYWTFMNITVDSTISNYECSTSPSLISTTNNSHFLQRHQTRIVYQDTLVEAIVKTISIIFPHVWIRYPAVNAFSSSLQSTDIEVFIMHQLWITNDLINHSFSMCCIQIEKGEFQVGKLNLKWHIKFLAKVGISPLL